MTVEGRVKAATTIKTVAGRVTAVTEKVMMSPWKRCSALTKNATTNLRRRSSYLVLLRNVQRRHMSVASIIICPPASSISRYEMIFFAVLQRHAVPNSGLVVKVLQQGGIWMVQMVQILHQIVKLFYWIG
jgi:hypothetical protein